MRRYGSFVDHYTPWKVALLRRFGFVVMGPYHTGKWYVFYGKRAEARRALRAHTGG